MAIFIAVIILLAIVAAAYLVNRALQQRRLAQHGGDRDAALADNQDPIPIPPSESDADRPLGDTAEAHDELSPVDVPPWDRTTREAAEKQERAK